MLKRFKIWYKVYQRIHFFKTMYPLSSLTKDLFLFPRDYFLNHRSIYTVRNVTMAITHRCNLRCKMCYFHEELNNIRELPLDLYKRIIDAVKRTRPCIILSGGEPFLHPHLLDMVMYAKKTTLPVQIFTNGTLVKPDIIDNLVKLGLDYINFTLLGNEQSHPLVAESPKSYVKLVENLRYFAGHRGKTKIILNYTVTPQALNDIVHTIELIERYNLDGLRIQHYNFLLPDEFQAQAQIMKTLFGRDFNTHEIERMEDISDMAQHLINFKNYLSKTIPDVPVQWAPTLTDAEIKHWYSPERFRTQRKCLYPWRGILVDADGKIYPCSKIYLELGNLRDQDVFDAWNSGHMKRFRAFLKKGLFPTCSRCCKL